MLYVFHIEGLSAHAVFHIVELTSHVVCVSY